MRALQHTLRAAFHRFRESLDPLCQLRRLLLIHPTERPAQRLRLRVDMTHRRFDGVVSGDVLQRDGVRMLSRLGQNVWRRV